MTEMCRRAFEQCVRILRLLWHCVEIRHGLVRLASEDRFARVEEFIKPRIFLPIVSFPLYRRRARLAFGGVIEAAPGVAYVAFIGIRVDEIEHLRRSVFVYGCPEERHEEG
jgi:hypothetical protein